MVETVNALSFGWHVTLRGNKTLGPYAVEDLSKLWERGEIGPETLCWREGFDEWLPLHRIAPLSAALLPKLAPLHLESVHLEAQATASPATSELLKALAQEETAKPPEAPASAASTLDGLPAVEAIAAAPLVWVGEPEENFPPPASIPPQLSYRSSGTRAGALLALAIGGLGLALWLWPEPAAMAVVPQVVTEAPEALSASSVSESKPVGLAQPGEKKAPVPSRGKVDDDFTRTFGGSGAAGISHAEPTSEKVSAAAAKPQRMGLSEGAVAETVWAHRPEVDECVRKQREAAPSVKGRVVMKWTVGPDGKVNSVAVSPEALRQSLFAQCLKGKLATWEFPRAGQASETVTFPFVF